MMVPNRSLGISSSVPPTFVTIADVPHAADSSSVVANPSEREGRQ